MQYQDLSTFYDILSDDQPYDLWFDIIQHIQQTNHYTSILDLGCGTGTLTMQFPQIFNTVYGVDMSPSMIAIAETKSRDVIWQMANR